MRKAWFVVFSTVLLVFAVGLQGVNAYSETFEIIPLQTVNRSIELQKNDRLTVSFNVTNAEPSPIVSARLTNPEKQIVLSHTNNKGNSFSYIAENSGTYTIGFVLERNPTQENPNGNPKITINYDIESIQPTPTQSTPPTQPTDTTSSGLNWIVIPIALVIATAVVALLIRAKRAGTSRN